MLKNLENYFENTIISYKIDSMVHSHKDKKKDKCKWYEFSNVFQQARKPGTVEIRISNSDGRTDGLTDWRTDGPTWRTDQRTEGGSNI